MLKNIIKWVICDLDGTLLRYENFNHVIDKKAINAIASLENKNIEFTIATGRHYKDALKICINNDLIKKHTNYIIGSNGGIIFDIKKQEIIYQKLISKDHLETSLKIFNYLQSKKLQILLAGYHLNRNIVFAPRIKTKRNLVNEFLNYEGHFSTFEFNESNNFIEEKEILKTIFFFDQEQVKNPISIKKIFDEIINEFSLNMNDLTITSLQTIEYNPSGVSKGNAAKMLSKLLKIDLDQTLSIGDSGNDISMFNVTKYSATLNSSLDSVKSKATKIFLSEASEIVADAINYFLKQ